MNAACKSCSAALLWVIMPSGRTNPMNAEPHTKGNVRVRERKSPFAKQQAGHLEGIILKGPVLEEARAAGEPLYLSHFADCKQAGSWRRR